MGWDTTFYVEVHGKFYDVMKFKHTNLLPYWINTTWMDVNHSCEKLLLPGENIAKWMCRCNVMTYECDEPDEESDGDSEASNEDAEQKDKCIVPKQEVHEVPSLVHLAAHKSSTNISKLAHSIYKLPLDCLHKILSCLAPEELLRLHFENQECNSALLDFKLNSHAVLYYTYHVRKACAFHPDVYKKLSKEYNVCIYYKCWDHICCHGQTDVISNEESFMIYTTYPEDDDYYDNQLHKYFPKEAHAFSFEVCGTDYFDGVDKNTLQAMNVSAADLGVPTADRCKKLEDIWHYYWRYFKHKCAEQEQVNK